MMNASQTSQDQIVGGIHPAAARTGSGMVECHAIDLDADKRGAQPLDGRTALGRRDGHGRKRPFCPGV